ncbi:Hypothetical predicted protein, partial [Pelobates cultripes]
MNKLPTSTTGNTIICGDLNHVLSSHADTSLPNTSPRHSAMRTQSKALHHLLTEHNLYDTWRMLHPMEKGFTYFSQVHKSFSRIDYALV